MDIIGITGKARSGKDTLADYFVKRHGFRRIAFADPIKRALCAMLRDPTLFDAERKEAQIPHLGVTPCRDPITPRLLAQTLGTEWGRNIISPNLWVDLMMREAYLTGANRVVVTDVRFENEADLIRDLGGYIVHIERPGAATVRAHSSEAGVTLHEGDFRIINEYSLDALHGMAEGVWSEIERRQAEKAEIVEAMGEVEA
jgi:hypothetical protein